MASFLACFPFWTRQTCRLAHFLRIETRGRRVGMRKQSKKAFPLERSNENPKFEGKEEKVNRFRLRGEEAVKVGIMLLVNDCSI